MKVPATGRGERAAQWPSGPTYRRSNARQASASEAVRLVRVRVGSTLVIWPLLGRVRGVLSFGMPEIERGAEQRDVGEGLRKIPDLST